MYYWIALAAVIVVVIFLSGMRVVRPTTRGLVERLGKYRRFANPGFQLGRPVIDRLFKINVTEVMVNAEPQEIITSDKLNASVDAQVYFRVKSDEENVKNSQYAGAKLQISDRQPCQDHPAQYHRHNDLKSANSERGMINSELQKTLRSETGALGYRHCQNRIERDRSSRGCPGDDEQGREGGERKGCGNRFCNSHGDDGRRLRAERKSRRRKESGRRKYWKLRARPRRSSLSTKLLTNISSVMRSS